MTSIAKQTNPNASNYGDILFTTTGDLLLVGSVQGTSQQEILQSIIENISVFLGEWFLDLTLGVDYYGQVFVKNPNVSAINAMLLTAILSTPGVTLVTGYSFTPNFITRALAVAFSCQTTAGVINYAGLIS